MVWDLESSRNIIMKKKYIFSQSRGRVNDCRGGEIIADVKLETAEAVWKNRTKNGRFTDLVRAVTVKEVISGDKVEGGVAWVEEVNWEGEKDTYPASSVQCPDV